VNSLSCANEVQQQSMVSNKAADRIEKSAEEVLKKLSSVIR
jgi:hypothetical protein